MIGMPSCKEWVVGIGYKKDGFVGEKDGFVGEGEKERGDSP